jgi:hypothetical protein
MDRNTNPDLERLKEMAAADDEDPAVSTVDPQIRTTRFTMFPDPKHTEEAPERASDA